ncbi:hypothetical protein [Pelagibius sp.]|uniref:hypothetical protein n=1 Tax=Pelagibius sp. TaxID=1931238 RepID=UPI002637D90A|nr:hypothetical protein [Pelagibius sp.]
MNSPLATQQTRPTFAGESAEGAQDRDSLHILPLSIVPLVTPGLRRARLVKNAKLEGMVELFAGTHTGSGQIAPTDLPGIFEFDSRNQKDVQLVKILSQLSSYDVYSLRVEMRRLGIEIDAHSHLRLSEPKVRELAPQMRAFTRPLVAAVYGRGQQDSENIRDLFALFMDPDAAVARRNLNRLARKLRIPVTAIPKFLEDYGDVYLSLAYYQWCLDENMVRVSDFLGSLEDLRQDTIVRQDRPLLEILKELDDKLRGVIYDVSNILEMFRLRTADMWDDMSADSFHEMEDMVIGYQTKVGGALCAVTVKMDAWTRRFPNHRACGPSRQVEFILSDLRHGLQGIQDLHC